MKRFALMMMLMVGTAALFAQAPKGWKERVDRSTSASDPDAPAQREHRGQGLFVAKTYMAKMGGTIGAANTGDGVTFTLALPRAM